MFHVKRLRIWIFLVFMAVGASVIAAWLVSPVLLHPYIRVAGSSVSLALKCPPQTVTLETLTGYATLKNARLARMDSPFHTAAQENLVGAGRHTVQGVDFVVTVPQDIQKKMAADAAISQAFGSGFRAVFELATIPTVDVSQVEVTYAKGVVGQVCVDATLTGDTLAPVIVESHSRPLRWLYMQDKLSDLIYRGNETIGNLLLAGLVLSAMWLLALTGTAFIKAYFIPTGRLRSHLAAHAAESPNAQRVVAEALAAQYGLTYRRLAFARVVGPAMGFLLTVSSLVAGLHPSASPAQDTSRFVFSLQLALVATFMGLVVRILAELTLRFERAAADRALEIAQEPRL